MKRKDLLHNMESLLRKRRGALRKTLAGELLPTVRSTGGDVVDKAVDAEQSEIRSQLAEVESRELMRVEHALERIESSQYGFCETCGDQIPLTRLKAIPYATLCIRCQRTAEIGRQRNDISLHWDRIHDVDTERDITLDDVQMNML